MAAAYEIGWSPVPGASCEWITASGRRLDLRAEAPLHVRHLAEVDVEAALWRQAAGRHEHLAHLDGPP